MHDACRDVRRLKILTVVDEFARRCLTVEVEHRMPASFVCQRLLWLFGEHGRPVYVRSDNGSEFIAKVLMRALAAERVGVRHIDPGSPWQNGVNERFNECLRDECLDMETFEHRDQARAVCRLYARQYNERRPHSAFGDRTRAEFAAEIRELVTRSAAKQRTSEAVKQVSWLTQASMSEWLHPWGLDNTPAFAVEGTSLMTTVSREEEARRA
jgi:transposase InsO family protein